MNTEMNRIDFIILVEAKIQSASIFDEHFTLYILFDSIYVLFL